MALFVRSVSTNGCCLAFEHCGRLAAAHRPVSWQVRRICLSPEYKSDYEALFDLGYESADELQQQYAAAFGSSYDAMDPTLATLFATVEADDRNFD